jgi:hypothetical protein
MHRARHICVSMMIAGGDDIGGVLRAVGHSTVVMTLDDCTHRVRGSVAPHRRSCSRSSIRETDVPDFPKDFPRSPWKPKRPVFSGAFE